MRISSEQDLAAAVREARGPLRIRGGGTRTVGRPVAGELLDLSALSGVRLYEPGALTLVVGAGTPLAEVERLLAGEVQRLAFEPADWRALLGTSGEPTIGGAVAANVSGPRRIQAGACRDALLGLRFVDGRGTVIRNGGRVMKNVTGYDLVRLLAGSWGTLGVLSEVALKVLPQPEAEATLRLPGAGIAEMARAMASPFEVSGAAALDGAVLLRIEGFAGSVAYRGERLRALFGPGREIEMIGDVAQSRRLWRAVRDVTALAGCEIVWRVAAAASVMRAALLDPLLGRVPHRLQLDWAGALAWVGMSGAEAAEAERVLGLPAAQVPGGALHHALQARVADRALVPGGGHVTLMKGPEALRRAVTVFQPEPAPLAALAAGLRAEFDPRGILNPGLMD